MEVDTKVVEKINYLKSFYGTYRQKCLRNLRAYENSPNISIYNMTDTECAGYYQTNSFDNNAKQAPVQENVIRSCIDTLTSKIASQKVRPFINTVNATFREMQVAKQAQDYFDAVFDEQNANEIVTYSFKDACVFDKGVIYIDKNRYKISRLMPWQVFVDPHEVSYGRLTRIVWVQEQYPVTLLPIKVDEDRYKTVTYYQFWDLNTKKHYYYIPELQRMEVEKWEANALPFIFIRYTNPIKGNTSQSIVDLLYGIQQEIDMIMTKIKKASREVPIQTFFVNANASDVKVDEFENGAGQMVTYTPSPNASGDPIHSSTTPFMDPQWMQTVEVLKQHAYEAVGISQLSATSQKPQGLNSGVALSTMEDIESDRFETQLNSVIRCYVDIARMFIQLIPADEDILPPNKFRSTIKWADIVEMRDQMKIQFSAAQALSKDPSQKLQQLQALYAAGLIPQQRIAQLMDLPDLQLGYSISNNSINAVLAVIDDCLENDNFDIPDYIPAAMLQEEIMNTCLSLKAANNIKNAADISKLMKLYQLSVMKNIDAQTNAEMAAVGTLTQELNADMADPNGQINTAVANANTQVEQANAMTNNTKATGDIKNE